MHEIAEIARVQTFSIESAAMQPEKLLAESRAGSRDRQRILRLAGSFTMATLSVFQDALNAGDAPSLIIEMSEVSRIDSAGVGALVQAYVSCRRAGGRLALVGVNTRVQDVLQTAGFDKLFAAYARLGEAEQALA